MRPALRVPGLRRITISTSRSSAVRKFIRRSTEKPSNWYSSRNGCGFIRGPTEQWSDVGTPVFWGHTAHLSGEGVSPGNFLFHLVFFPAAYIFSGEGFSMVAVVPGITSIRQRVVNLLPNPSLIRCDWRSAMSALVVHAGDHFLLLLDDHIR